jgi:hypothetical protein
VQSDGSNARLGILNGWQPLVKTRPFLVLEAELGCAVTAGVAAATTASEVQRASSKSETPVGAILVCAETAVPVRRLLSTKTSTNAFA